MNYRHAFHAGNHADVFKHAVLALILTYLSKKDKAWRYIDTHAGRGTYDLSSQEAERSPEWRSGIARLLETDLPPQAAELAAPYLGAVRAANPDGALSTYPGSPAIARALARPQDRLSLIERHPGEFEALAERFSGDWQVRCVALDGWLALRSFVPPKERRGLVLIDPPFEAPGEFDRLIEGLQKAHKRWRDGIYALWYPIKDLPAVEAFKAGIAQSGLTNSLCTELTVRAPTGASFDGSGLVIVNPPFTLAEQLKHLGPALAARLSLEGGGGAVTRWLSQPT